MGAMISGTLRRGQQVRVGNLVMRLSPQKGGVIIQSGTATIGLSKSFLDGWHFVASNDRLNPPMLEQLGERVLLVKTGQGTDERELLEVASYQ